MIGTGIAMLVAGLASAGGSVYGAAKQGSAANKAAQLTTASNDRASAVAAKANADALAYAKQNEATRRQEFQQTQDRNYAQYMARDAQLSPFREAGAQSVRTLASLMPPGASGAAYEVQPPRPLMRG